MMRRPMRQSLSRRDRAVWMTVWVLLPALGIEGEASLRQVLARLSLLYRLHGPVREMERY